MGRAEEIEWLRSTVGVLVLDDRAVISVRGDDAAEWLQGQLTNQVEGLGPGESVYGFVLTPKGRIAADVWGLIRAENDIWLDAPKRAVDALLERLDRYVIMEDVDLLRHPELRLIAAQGPNAQALSSDGFRCDRLGTGGRVRVVSEDELESESIRLASGAEALGGGLVSYDAWSDAHLALGRPRFGIDFGDWTYPQESGLSSIAVSFTKGCYLGQETVMMLQSRGKAPKVLWRWAIECAEPPPARTPIERDGKVVGEVTSAARVGREVLAFGFLKRGHGEEPGSGFLIAGAAARPLGPVDEPRL